MYRPTPHFVAALVAIAALVTFAASAQEVQRTEARVSYTLPTQNTDGSAIPADGDNALKLVEVQRGTCNTDAFGTAEQTVEVPVAETTFLFMGLAERKHCFRARAVNNANAKSNWSATVSKTIAPIAPKKPRPPGGVKVAGIPAGDGQLVAWLTVE